MKSENLILSKTIEFSVAVIAFSEVLIASKKYVVATQLLKSGTSIGANVFEAQHAESKADFIHKLKIANKEANETLYWLVLCERSEGYPFESSLLDKVKEIVRILSKIIISSKKDC